MAGHGMRPLGALLSKEEALARMLAVAAPIARAERVLLLRAGGRVCAEEVRAPFDVPGFARSTMDGHAVRSEDVGVRRVVGEIFAGAEGRALAAGEAVRIATGAPLPAGADAVVRVEDADEHGGAVAFRTAVRARQFVEPAGADLAKGDLVIARGALLTPARIGLLASLGRAMVLVVSKPRVAVAPTGDELLAPGAPAEPGRIYESNSATLATLFEANGADVRVLPVVGDSLDSFGPAFDADVDLLVFTGGVSAGAKDLVVDALRARGEVIFHGVRVKPGKPLLVGRAGRTVVAGLPGNPTSALSNACLFLVPALRQLAGLPPARPAAAEARLGISVKGEGGRYLFLPVKLAEGVATPTFKGSGALTSIAASDGWVGVPEGAELPVGSPVVVQAWW